MPIRIELSAVQTEHAMVDCLVNGTVSTFLARVASALESVSHAGDPAFDDIARKASAQIARMSDYYAAQEDRIVTPVTCAQCGQRPTDGLPCDHGARRKPVCAACGD